ncbi:extracellular solute-binding protein [Cohnella sp. CFH 77786]|uniref:ABC transporter substrate-binding protein n=1 Tax=Cohnella sp. CFH 77786 TaxID=2662265 RepID=UPI001C60EB05|nr:extracellular solute-binding protein [Cohnella sp. CFH 77786]MBW5445735.1 extracellular solute-binding protein [Cohnella sp. CFH 77786]
MKTRKWTVLLTVAAMLLALLSACGGRSNNDEGAASPPATQSASPSAGASASPEPSGAKEKSKLLVYDWQTSDSAQFKIMEDMIAEYNAKPDAKATLTSQHLPGSDVYYPKLNASLAANSGPDVFPLHGAGKLKTYSDAGRLMDLTGILDAEPDWKNSFTSGAFNLLTQGGKIYAVPTSFAAVPLFYNKDIFAKYNLQPPQTYDDLKNVVKVLKDNGVTPFAFGSKDAWTSALFSEMIANRIGGDEPFNKILDGSGSWTDPSFIETGKVLNELKDLGAFPKGFLGLDNNAINNMFKNGEAAMFVMGSWAIGNMVKEDSKVKNSVGIAKFPTFPGGKGDIDVWLGQPSYNLAINASTKDKDAAIDYLKMFTSDKYQQRIAIEAGEIPATNVQLDPAKVPAISQDLQKAMSTMKGMFIFYDVGLGAKIGDEYNKTIQGILAGKKVEDAFQALEQYTKDNRG